MIYQSLSCYRYWVFANEPFGGLIPGPHAAVLAVLLRTTAALTGRQVHKLVSPRASQQTVQRALHELTALGVVDSTPAGRAILYTVNQKHVAVPALRTLASPLDLLRQVVAGAIAGTEDQITAVVLFGSVARGEASRDSDIDLAVVAEPNWVGRANLWHEVGDRFGGRCDVLQYSPTDFVNWAESGEEPVLRKIVAEGITLWGITPKVRKTKISTARKES